MEPLNATRRPGSAAGTLCSAPPSGASSRTSSPLPLMKSVAIPRLDPSFKPSPGYAGITRTETSIPLHVPQPPAIPLPEPENVYYVSSDTICPQPATDQHNMLSLNQNHNLS